LSTSSTGLSRASSAMVIRMVFASIVSSTDRAKRNPQA
jgi:hypothetical protein